MTLGALVAIICVIDGNIGGAVVALAIGGLFHCAFGGHNND